MSYVTVDSICDCFVPMALYLSIWYNLFWLMEDVYITSNSREREIERGAVVVFKNLCVLRVDTVTLYHSLCIIIKFSTKSATNASFT